MCVCVGGGGGERSAICDIVQPSNPLSSGTATPIRHHTGNRNKLIPIQILHRSFYKSSPEQILNEVNTHDEPLRNQQVLHISANRPTNTNNQCIFNRNLQNTINESVTWKMKIKQQTTKSTTYNRQHKLTSYIINTEQLSTWSNKMCKRNSKNVYISKTVPLKSVHICFLTFQRKKLLFISVAAFHVGSEEASGFTSAVW